MGRVTMVMRDYDGDKKQFSVGVADTLASANFDANEAAAEAIRDAVLAVTLGNLAAYSWTVTTTAPADSNPSSPVAQTNIQWLVTCIDAVDGNRFTFSIPTAEISDVDLFLPNTSMADLSEARWVALVDALEAAGRSPSNHAFTVESIEYRE